MKTFNRIFVGLLGAFAIMVILSYNAKAGSLPRSPKQTFVTGYQTTASSVAVSTLSVSSVFIPGAVYQVNLSSGAASEFIVMVDTNTCTGVTVNAAYTAPAKQVGARLIYSSTTANTVFSFDPPLLFETGLCVIDSAATGQASITYEIGRGLSGN